MALSVTSLALSQLSISCHSSTFSPSLWQPRSCPSSLLILPSSPFFASSSTTGIKSKPPVFHFGRQAPIKVLAAASSTSTTKKPDSAAKRARQAEKRHLYNKSRKSEIKTRMKKMIFVAFKNSLRCNMGCIKKLTLLAIIEKEVRNLVVANLFEVFAALDVLKQHSGTSSEDIKPVEVLIGEAYSVIDKAVKVGTLHRNTGNRRKSRLARAKKMAETELGWYAPVAAVS